MDTIVTKKSKQIGIILSGSLAGFMVMLDSNIVNIALPYIGKYFNIGTSLVVQITLVYLLVLSGVMLIVGKLADRTGIKKIFIIGFVIFTLSSLTCGLSQTFWLLLLSRAIQAVGGAMMIVTTLTLVTKFIPAEKRGWSFGILTPINSLGVIVGVPLGGIITGYLNWHWIFLINVPIGIAAVIVARIVIPDDSGGAETKKNIFSGFDFTGAILSFTGLTVLVFFLNQGRQIGWTSPITIFGVATSFALLFLFWLVEKRSKDPLLDLTIFHNRKFSLGIIASVFAYGLMAGNSVLMPFYIEYLLHIRVEHAGFVIMTFSVVFTLLSPISGRLSDRVTKSRMTSTGMIFASLACLFFVFFLPRMQLAFVFIFLVMLGISYALFITPNNNLVMSLAKGGRHSVISGVFRLSTNIGQLLGILVMEAMFILCLPPSTEATAKQLHEASKQTLLTGFQYSYLGAFILVFLSMTISLLIREKKFLSGSAKAEKDSEDRRLD
jgi:EmrB/QacA subfamily drug resistance transporter